MSEFSGEVKSDNTQPYGVLPEDAAAAAAGVFGGSERTEEG